MSKEKVQALSAKVEACDGKEREFKEEMQKCNAQLEGTRPALASLTTECRNLIVSGPL